MMYTREHNDFLDGVPDNYNGIAMKGKRPDRHACEDSHECDKRESDDTCKRDDTCDCDVCKRPVIEPRCHEKKSAGLLSSLLDKLGLGGIDTTELVILFVALLLMSEGDCGDEENYIWVILLLLLLIN